VESRCFYHGEIGASVASVARVSAKLVRTCCTLNVAPVLGNVVSHSRDVGDTVSQRSLYTLNAARVLHCAVLWAAGTSPRASGSCRPMPSSSTATARPSRGHIAAVHTRRPIRARTPVESSSARPAIFSEMTTVRSPVPVQMWQAKPVSAHLH
jgi:hypothetical protein